LCLAQTTVSTTASTTASELPVVVSPNVLIFRQAGSVTPTAQTLAVSVRKGTLGALTVTTSGGSWLTATATGATVSVSVNTAGLASGKYSGAVGIAAAGFVSANVDVSLTVSGNNVIVDPEKLNFTAMVGGEADPNPKMVDVYNEIGSAFNWTATSDQTWLTISATTGSGKSSIGVSVNPAKLTAAGSFTGHVTVTDTSNSTTATVTVNLTATAPAPPSFQMGPYLNQPGVLYFVADTNLATLAPKIFYGRNLGGGGPLSFTLSSTVISPTGGTWLAFTPASNTTPGLTKVTVNPAGLAPGAYSATISGVATEPAGVTGGALKAQVTVYLVVLGNPAIRLDRKFMRFTSSTAVTPPAPSPASETATFVTRNASGYPFTAAATTSTGGSWLSVTPTSGTALSGGTIAVSVVSSAVAGLAPGFYTGKVQVNFTGGAPTAQRTIGVGLRVYGPSATPVLVVNPGGVLFVATAGGANPAAKDLKVRSEGVGTAGLAFTASTAVSTPSGGSWLSTSVTSGTATSTATDVPISVNTTGLAAGVYTGAVSFTPAPASNAAVQIVNVYLIVTKTAIAVDREPGSLTGAAPLAAEAAFRGAKLAASTVTFAAGPLYALIMGPSDNFTWSTDSAMDVTVTLVDSAGNAVPGATVILSSSNGEPDITMDDLENGSYSCLFQPAAGGTVTLSVAAQASDSTGALFQASGSVVTGDVESATDVLTPVYADGAVGAASFAPQPTPLTPGGLVSLFGTNIAGSGGVATVVPLPSSLGAASVTIGGVAAPLFAAFPASETGGLDQVNLQVPVELDGQPEADIVVTSNGVVGAPQTVALGAAPAFFTLNEGGTGDGVFLHTNGVTLITAADPAAIGEVIVLYATGLGDVQAAVSTGSAATAADKASGSVSVTIGGAPATVQYAGLAPYLVGVYQINVVVPKGLPAGENSVVVYLNGIPATGQATVEVQ
jgi:uncharacterized protein (TIGR03437 family)